MDRRFHLLHPAMTIREAVKAFRDATREEGRKVFGMLVTVSPETHLLVIADADIVGLLYRYCHACRKSTRTRPPERGDDQVPIELTVGEVMTSDVQFVYEIDTLYTVIETL
jgi:hypothetical protein